MRLRLLERIRAAGKGRAAAEGDGREALAASLERHLSLILNTHQGSSASAPDFGMPDFMSLSSQTDLDSLRELTADLTEVIRKYEPRLRDPQVVPAPPGQEGGGQGGGPAVGVLEFAVSGTAELERESVSLFFSSSISPDGRVIVKK
jgi:type VI secretion system protein